MYIVDSLGMCGNIRYSGINLSNFQCPLQLRCLIYEDMLNSSTCIVFLAFCGCKFEKCDHFLIHHLQQLFHHCVYYFRHLLHIINNFMFAFCVMFCFRCTFITPTPIKCSCLFWLSKPITSTDKNLHVANYSMIIMTHVIMFRTGSIT